MCAFLFVCLQRFALLWWPTREMRIPYALILDQIGLHYQRAGQTHGTMSICSPAVSAPQNATYGIKQRGTPDTFQ